jgi:TRAP-type C4-dicarboxylate transport system substrate-binding protein
MRVTVFLLATLFLSFGLYQSVMAKTLKIATFAPAGTTWMKEMKKGANNIKKATDGRVKLKFYPGGVMGNDKSVHRKIKIGQLHGGAFTAGALAHIDPAIQSLSLPMLFDSEAEVEYVRKNMDSSLKQSMEKNGFVLLGISGAGFAQILSKTPLTDLESIRSSKVWLPEGDRLIQETFDTLGISPISLPISDVFIGLQTGLIETVTVNPTAAIAFQWHTSTAYMTDTPVIYLVGLLAIQKKAFNKISAADQLIVKAEVDSVFKRLTELNRVDNEKASAALKTQGIQFVKPSSTELARWKSLSEQSIKNMVKKGYLSQDRIDEVFQLLSAFRSAQ